MNRYQILLKKIPPQLTPKTRRDPKTKNWNQWDRELDLQLMELKSLYRRVWPQDPYESKEMEQKVLQYAYDTRDTNLYDVFNKFFHVSIPDRVQWNIEDKLLQRARKKK